MSACWVVGCLFVLAGLGRHVMSVSNPPCGNHWTEIAFFGGILAVAILAAFGKRMPTLLLLVPAIVLFLYCGAEAVLCSCGFFAGGPMFELMYRPILGTLLGLGTIVTLAIAWERERSSHAS